MSSGAIHYREAERLLELAGLATADQASRTVIRDRTPVLLQAALVHATLARVGIGHGRPSDWHAVFQDRDGIVTSSDRPSGGTE